MSLVLPLAKQLDLSIELEEGIAFAKLSGDYNPLHVDPDSSRAAIFGTIIPHGVLVLLRTLELVLADCESGTLQRLKCQFHKPVHYGRPILCALQPKDNDSMSLVLRQQDVIVQRATVSVGRKPTVLLPPTRADFSTECRPMDHAEAITQNGELPLGLDMQLASDLFPVLTSRIPLVQIAEVCAWTRLIGMECPGLHSVFTSIDVRSRESVEPAESLHFRVNHANAALQYLNLYVEGPTLSGGLEALLRS